MRKLLYIVAVCGLLFSCSSEDPENNIAGAPSALEISAHIKGARQTRAVTNADKNVDDDWSYTGFTAGDRMGFFSSGGNFSADNGAAPFNNQLLIYTDNDSENFVDPDGSQFSPSHMKGDEVFMYFPYSYDITTDQGMTLRVMPDGENHPDSVRCVDFLSASNLTIMGDRNGDRTALFGEFLHSFAELIIMRGDGFDHPANNDWSIRAVLRDPFTGIKVNVTDSPWACTPELVSNEFLTDEEREAAKSWYAWLGENYFLTSGNEEGRTAWYVIVPTIGCQSKLTDYIPGYRSTVEYIELYDNDGNLQRVSTLLLSNGNSKYVDAGWRYPMEITMKELVPTANPCTIVPWNGDIDLTEERTRGINDEIEFAKWVAAYNRYLIDSNETEPLLQFGDRFIDEEGNSSWHFYILKNINLLNYKQADGSTPTGPLVPVLNDILDGQSMTLSNGEGVKMSISGLSYPLIGTLSGENAQVLNLNFNAPSIINNEGMTSPAGVIASSVEGGASIENCIIDNGTLFNPGGPGGMVAGTVTDSKIEGCVLSGSLFATSTASVDGGKIAGVVSGNYNVVDNDSFNVTFLNTSEDNDEIP